MFWFLFFVVLTLAVCYRRASLQTATAVFGGGLLAYGVLGDSFGLFGLWLLVFVAVAVPLNMPAFRQEWLSRPALESFRRLLPRLSASERIALEAGTVWWEGELFGGAPNFERLRAIPAPRLSPEEQAFLDGPVEEFCKLCNDWRITARDRDLTPAAWAFLKEQRFFGLIIPRDFGGLEFSAQAHSAILHKIASGPGGVTAASIVAVPNSLGPAELLLHYGTVEQKQQFLPRLAVGTDIPCFALTSPWAGSDAGSIPDKGIVRIGLWKGRETLGIALSFDKRYITLAPVATVVGLAFRLYDPEKLLGEIEDIGITCALIPRDTPGLEIGKRHWPLDNPFLNGPVRGHDVFVPLEAIIGGPAMAGHGWRMLMECLAMGRGISLPSASAGGATLAAFGSGAYARIRRQFGLPIGSFEGVQEALARIGGQTYAINALREFSATAVDLGERPAVASAIAKLHNTAMTQDILKHAMDIHAGKGVMLGPSNYIARQYQGAPIAVTVEGANILTRSMIVFGQGAIRCHPWVLKEIAAVNESNAALALERFDQALWGHVGHVLTAASRSLVLGLSFAHMAAAPTTGSTRQHYQRLARYSACLALMADAAMALLGGKLKFREMISGRLGDVLSQLFIVSAALRRFEAEGRHSGDLPLLDWVAANAWQQIELALDGVLRHLQLRPVAWLLRALIFPLGRHARPPSDTTQRDIAGLLQTPGGARARLTANTFVPDDIRYPTGLLKIALRKVLSTEALDDRLRAATREGLLHSLHPFELIGEAMQQGLITQDEAQQLRETCNLVEQVCQVDEFDPNEMVLSARLA